jgi:alpha-methylacyl-CoA racemase
MGPLHGFRIVEIAGLGPTQFCGMLLADMGAQLIRIDRPHNADPGVDMPAKYNLTNRSRPAIAVDLKSKDGVDLVLRLCDDADAFFEGFRPGVMERIGLGPDDCMARNERLVYGRMTGWGQEGPLANSVGHDANYIALAGALGSIGRRDRSPPLPLNLIGDLGGGALYLAMGMLAAMLEAGRSGKGQVVDAAMVDGVASMMTMYYGLLAGKQWIDKRQSNLLDGGAPFARTYETSDGKYVAVCALEQRFYAALLEALGISEIHPADQHDVTKWDEHRSIFRSAFASKTRAEWCELLEGTEACVTPVLKMTEAPRHPHNAARQTFVTVDGIEQPAPAPRFSRTRAGIQHAPTTGDNDPRQALRDWGLDDSEFDRFMNSKGNKN